MTDSLHLRLRAATQERHDELENTLGLLDDDIVRERYISVLRIFGGVYRSLEEQIDAVIYDVGLAGVLQWSRRRKVPMLHDDLAYFEVEPASVVVPVVVKDAPSMVGVMYVMEGATLGARIIQPHLRERMGISGGISFFDAYGNNGPLLWKRFRHYLSSIEMKPAQEGVIAGAQNTFDVFLGAVKEAR